MKLKRLLKEFKDYSIKLNELERKSIDLIDLSISSIYNSFELWTNNDLKLYYGEDIHLAEKLYQEYMKLDQEYSKTVEMITDWHNSFGKVIDGYNDFNYISIRDGLIELDMLIEQDIENEEEGGDT